MTTLTPAELQHELETNLRHMKDMCFALREALEKQKNETQEKIEDALVTAKDEIRQLKLTIQAMRDELDAQKVKREEDLQTSRRDSEDEKKQLRQTVQLLRDELEKCHAK